jgi:phosphatidylserine/phosphatidylglycerophosphate/cardiolipin synthase-like enzyme
MSIIRKSEDLEIIVLRIFEDFCKFGGEFYIISPWIQNFSFSEGLSSEFGREPSLYSILKRCSECQPNAILKIITHNFGIKSEHHPTHAMKKAQELNTIISECSITKDIPSIFEFYLSLLKNYQEYSKFNNPWVLTSYHNFNDLIESAGNKDNYNRLVFDLVHGLGQVNFNLQYLNDLRKLLEIDNVKVMLHNNFHAKIFLAGSSCVTGSSNWTFSGFVKNDEINLFFSKLDAQEEMAKIKERCLELERQAAAVDSEKISFFIQLHKCLNFIYSSLFDWFVDNKCKLIRGVSEVS